MWLAPHYAAPNNTQWILGTPLRQETGGWGSSWWDDVRRTNRWCTDHNIVYGLSSDSVIDHIVYGLSSDSVIDHIVYGLSSDSVIDHIVYGLSSDSVIDHIVYGLSSDQS